MEKQQFSDAEERILSAALKVVNEATVGGTRMHAIAEKADMVQSNVHYYYKTKQDLLDSLQERVLQEFDSVHSSDRVKRGDTLEEQLHCFFEEKKLMVTKKKDYDFAEMNFMVQSKINPKMRKRFCECHAEWKESIQKVISQHCPTMKEEDKKRISCLVLSLLEGASMQSLIEGNQFNIEQYFACAEEMTLAYIKEAMKKAEE